MMKDILFTKRLGFPWVSVLLAINAIMVSFVCFIYPGMGWVFAARSPMHYPWLPITTLLVHGWPGMTVVIHLGGNMAMLLTLGILVERVLGPGRTIFLMIVGGSFFVIPIIIFHGGGIGASWMIWSMGPAAFLILYRFYKVKGKEAFKDPFYHAMLYAQFLMWPGSVLFIVGVFAFGFDMFNIFFRLLIGVAAGIFWHLIPSIAGLVVAILWRKRIASRVEELLGDKPVKPIERSLLDRIAIGAMALWLAFCLVLLVLVAVGVIPYWPEPPVTS